MLISNFRNSLGYEFNYELNIFQPKISVDEESGRTFAPEDIVSLDGRIKYFIEDIYKAFKDYWHAPPLKTGIASLGYHPLDSLIDHSLIDINFSTEPKAPDDEDIIGAITVDDAGLKGSANTVSVSISDPKIRYDTRSVTFFKSEYLNEDRNNTSL